ncbi:hypothetical protein COY95_03340 [Candidatus Woesearchaeota archaeon CG_4_10_14_0_8_um_filter_47_5]|nr:MAG: hypothetical protein COY95_03340 [Candidatus Woesearchaeota archaeon CG_4_10_14_0_8_um_filter_47_5]
MLGSFLNYSALVAPAAALWGISEEDAYHALGMLFADYQKSHGPSGTYLDLFAEDKIREAAEQYLRMILVSPPQNPLDSASGAQVYAPFAAGIKLSAEGLTEILQKYLDSYEKVGDVSAFQAYRAVWEGVEQASLYRDGLREHARMQAKVWRRLIPWLNNTRDLLHALCTAIFMAHIVYREHYVKAQELRNDIEQKTDDLIARGSAIHYGRDYVPPFFLGPMPDDLRCLEGMILPLKEINRDQFNAAYSRAREAL